MCCVTWHHRARQSGLEAVLERDREILDRLSKERDTSVLLTAGMTPRSSPASTGPNGGLVVTRMRPQRVDGVKAEVAVDFDAHSVSNRLGHAGQVCGTGSRHSIDATDCPVVMRIRYQHDLVS